MRKYVLPLFLSLLFLQVMSAQQGDWFFNKPIEGIRFTGLENVRESDLRGLVNEFQGKLFTENLYYDLQSRLYGLNYFTRITAEALEGSRGDQSVIIQFLVKERPLVDRIEISGNRNIRNNEILDTILLKRDDFFIRTGLRTDTEAIRLLYLEKGYPDVEVSWEVEEDDTDNTVTVIFLVTEGSQTRIRSIRFSGNNTFSDSVLKGRISTKEQSLFSSGIFQERKLAEDINAVEMYYRQQGYIDASVIDTEREVERSDDGRNYLTLVFYIEEGDQWTYGGVEFQGNELFSDEELIALVRQRPGDVMNMTRLEADFSRVADHYFNDGYIYNNITRSEMRNTEERVISYIVNIEEKGRAHIENIIIRGNEKTKDHVLYREIPLETGDVFSKALVIQGIQNLYNTGLFSVVAPDTPYGSAEGLMDLVINVEEARTTDINFGVTFTGGAGDFPVMGFLKWTDNNFRGLGQKLSIGTELSSKRQSLTFEFNENWIADRRWSGGIDFTFERTSYDRVLMDMVGTNFTDQDYKDGKAAPDPYNSREEYEAALKEGRVIDDSFHMEYDEYSISLGLSTGYTFHTPVGRIGTGTGVRSALTYVSYDPDFYRPYNPNIRNNLDTFLFNNRWWMNLSWDRRNFIYNPTKGTFFNQIFTYGGGFLGGRTHFIKTQSRAQGFIKMLDKQLTDTWNFKTVLAMNTSFALVLDQFYRTPDGDWTTGVEAATRDLLYVDGMSTARGWGWMGGGNNLSDGKAMWDSWVELRMPVSEQVLWLDFFLSSTGFWREQSDAASMQLEDFYFSMGGGLRFTIPGLPIGLYLTRPFKFDSDGNFQAQTGALFNRGEGTGLTLVLAITAPMF